MHQHEKTPKPLANQAIWCFGLSLYIVTKSSLRYQQSKKRGTLSPLSAAKFYSEYSGYPLNEIGYINRIVQLNDFFTDLIEGAGMISVSGVKEAACNWVSLCLVRECVFSSTRFLFNSSSSIRVNSSRIISSARGGNGVFLLLLGKEGFRFFNFLTPFCFDNGRVLIYIHGT
jgi:hypothetical protein